MQFRFKYKKSIPLSYDRQGYVYFASRQFRELPLAEQSRIRALCREIGREYADALFAFVVQGANATAIETDYFCSKSTLYRLVREYYRRF